MTRETSQITNLFYYTIKEIIRSASAGDTLKGRTRRVVGKALEVFYSTRAAFIVWNMLHQYQSPYWHLDYLLCFARTNTHLYDILFATSIIFVGIFIHIAQTGLTQSPLRIWQHFYQLVVINMDLYRQAMRSDEEVTIMRTQRQRHLEAKFDQSGGTLIPKRALNVYFYLRTHWIVWRNMDHINLARMMRSPVIVLHCEAPIQLRVKLVQAIIIIDKVCCLIQISVYCLFVVYCTTYGPAFFRASSWHHLPLIVFDQLGVLYCFPVLIRCACIYSVCSFTSNLVYAYKLTKCDALVRRLIHRGRRVSTVSLNPNQCTTVVDQFEAIYRVHNRICSHVLYGDRLLWSRIMFSFLLTNVPANVYFLTHLLFDALPLFEQLFYSFLMSIQLVAATFTLLRLAKNAQLIYQFHRYIPAVQQLVSGRENMCCKFRLDQLMHRLVTGKYGMTVGPIILITYESVVKIMFLYVYYLMFAFHFRQQRLLL